MFNPRAMPTGPPAMAGQKRGTGCAAHHRSDELRTDDAIVTSHSRGPAHVPTLADPGSPSAAGVLPRAQPNHPGQIMS